ncbi:MAG TPA: DUF4331 domain-containing protein [Oculatellaceae cyanobacterium]
MVNKTITPLKTFLQRLVLGGSSKNLKKTLGLGVLALGLALIAATTPKYLRASDHDDGEVDTKGRNLNLTDLFVFREKDQQGGGSENLVFIMNTNPRSMPRQQYYFSNRARYEFKVKRVTDNNASLGANDYATPDITLRFEFGAPTGTDPSFKRQQIKLTVIRDGQIVANATSAGTTTPVRSNTPTVNNVAVAGAPVSVFAGLREDPFFFDVEQFFRVRAGALGFGPKVGFRTPETAIDDFKDVNVNAIAVRVPMSFLKGSSSATTYDVWETISVGSGNTFNQVERLARPAVNEGLVVTNEFLNALNMVGPEFEAAALGNQLPPDQQATANAIVGEAKNTLLKLGNTEERANALLGAFLPDVMRIDTTQASNYDVTIPPSCLNTKGSPICGRKLKDDVVDLTLKVLTGNQAATDNVSYEGNNHAQGHKQLSPNFPYLALPN